MARVADQSVETGNTIYLMIQNTPIGRAQTLTAQRGFGTEGIYEIGSIMPQEHVFLRYTGTLTLERYRMKSQSLASLGFAAMGEEVLTIPVIDIVTVNNLTKSVMEAYRGCSINTYNTEYRANQVTGENAEFMFLTSTTPQKAS
jgi:hypothetical protein